MTWQEMIEQQARAVGATKTSGYRSPERERALGGPSSSYHTRGTPDAPGALDIGGTAQSLAALFDKIKEEFKGRINELYLNIPGGRSVAIKGNRYLSTNPEEGRPQHLHVAIGGGPGAATGVPAPAEGIPAGNRGDKALAAAPADVCTRSLCFPTVASALGQAEPTCHCWSDVWMYGVGLFVIIGGSWMVFRSGGNE